MRQPLYRRTERGDIIAVADIIAVEVETGFAAVSFPVGDKRADFYPIGLHRDFLSFLAPPNSFRYQFLNFPKCHRRHGQFRQDFREPLFLTERTQQGDEIGQG